MTRRRILLWAGVGAGVLAIVGVLVWMGRASTAIWRTEELSIEAPSVWRPPWAPDAWIVARDPGGAIHWRTPIEHLGARELLADPHRVIVFAVESDRRVTLALDRQSGAEAWRAVQGSERDLTTYGQVRGLLLEDVLVETHSRPSFLRVLDLDDGTVRDQIDLEGDGTVQLVRGPTGVLVFGKLTDGPTHVYTIESDGRLTPASMPNAATSCATTSGMVSLDAAGWLFERPWGASDWTRRLQIGPGELHGCVSNRHWTVITWQPRNSSEPGNASPQPLTEEGLPLSRGSALLALPRRGKARGLAFGAGWLLLPELDAHIDARGSLPELDAPLLVEWTPPLHEHDDPRAATRRYRYDVVSNDLSAVGGPQ